MTEIVITVELDEENPQVVNDIQSGLVSVVRSALSLASITSHTYTFTRR